MKNTQIITAGTLLAAGEELSNATKVALQASTREYTLEVIITNGLLPEGVSELLHEVCFATSNTNGVAATVAALLTFNSEMKSSRVKSERSAVTYFRSKPFVPTGAFLYLWINHSKLPADATVDVWLNEADSTGSTTTITPSTPGVATKAAFVRALKAPASVAVPEALAAAGTYVSTVTIWAQRAARVANTSSVFIDSVSANDTQLIELIPGSFITLTAPPNKYIDLGEIYVDSVTLGDGVFILGLL